jgi:hypothetical protein
VSESRTLYVVECASCGFVGAPMDGEFATTASALLKAAEHQATHDKPVQVGVLVLAAKSLVLTKESIRIVEGRR